MHVQISTFVIKFNFHAIGKDFELNFIYGAYCK